MSEGNEVLFGHVEDDASVEEVYTGDHNDVEHDRRTWPLSHKSSASLGDSEGGFQYSVSPSLAGFLGENRPSLQEGNAGHGAPMGSRMTEIQPSTPRSAPDPGTGYLSDSQIPGSARDVSSAVAWSRLLNKKQNKTMKHAIAQGTVAPGQPSKVRRAKHKFLQVELDDLDSTDVRFRSVIHSEERQLVRADVYPVKKMQCHYFPCCVLESVVLASHMFHGIPSAPAGPKQQR